jgi:hypothetical protein
VWAGNNNNVCERATRDDEKVERKLTRLPPFCTVKRFFKASVTVLDFNEMASSLNIYSAYTRRIYEHTHIQLRYAHHTQAAAAAESNFSHDEHDDLNEMRRRRGKIIKNFFALFTLIIPAFSGRWWILRFLTFLALVSVVPPDGVLSVSVQSIKWKMKKKKQKVWWKSLDPFWVCQQSVFLFNEWKNESSSQPASAHVPLTMLGLEMWVGWFCGMVLSLD